MKGLTKERAAQILNKNGLNVISEQKKKPIYIKFFEQFNNFLTILLIIAAVFSLFLGETVDGVLIISIVVLNGFFGIYQEAKAEESLAALKEMTRSMVRVIRDGKQIEIESKFLVIGDIVYLEEGIKIPADGKIAETVNLEINESVLTGESLSLLKNINEEVFSGTIVAKGRGMMEVMKTGDATKFGQIAKNLSEIKDEVTPLQKKLADLTKLIGIGGIILSIIVLLISTLEGTGYFPAFLLAISIAVAVVPEGLPAVMTITLALGMKKMAGKKAILRRLSAIEALGSITLIATDKTGTLTTNKMQVKEIYLNNSQFMIPDFQSVFKFKKNNIKNDSANLLILNGILCSTASLVYVHDRKSYDVLGDPTEGALLYLAQKLDLNIDEARRNWKVIDEKPFDSVTKMMSVDVKYNSKMFFSKGAPESILANCNKILINGVEKTLTKSEKEKIVKQVDKWASSGLRVLAFSHNKSIFLGMVAIHDAPRLEVKEAVIKARSAGIKVVMITGDNEKTAEAVAVSSGLISQGDEIMTGSQLEQYSDEELLKILPRVKIFARTNPFQKHKIVKLYQQLGEVVAVTGDGVNDAIALKQADVGVAMGLVGTDVARETADMVITDDNFATIIVAIEEGRNIINNIKNSIKYLLACNVSEAVSLVIALVLGLPTLFYPIQLLYINLVTDGLPALMLSFSPRNTNLMTISPQKEMVLLKRKDQSYIFLVGLIGACLVVFSYFLYGNNFGKTAAFSVLTMVQSFVFIDLWLSHRPIHKHFIHLLSPVFLLGFIIPLVFQLIILIHPFTANIFKVTSVPIWVYFEFIGLSFLVLFGIKGVKKIISL